MGYKCGLIYWFEKNPFWLQKRGSMHTKNQEDTKLFDCFKELSSFFLQWRLKIQRNIIFQMFLAKRKESAWVFFCCCFVFLYWPISFFSELSIVFGSELITTEPVHLSLFIHNLLPGAGWLISVTLWFHISFDPFGACDTRGSKAMIRHDGGLSLGGCSFLWTLFHHAQTNPCQGFSQSYSISVLYKSLE